MKLLVEAGERVERFMAAAIRDVAVEDVECDEVWGFIARKEKTKRRKRISDTQQGDSYLWIGLDRRSNLVLAHHVSRRTNQAADAFAEKLDRATGGRLQISTDSFEPYVDSLNFHLGTRTSHGMIHKEFGYEEEGERRYSPPRLIGAEKATSYGEPDYDRIGTSYVERWNLSLRTGMKRVTRLTIAFSRCWRNHKVALALWIAYYNFVVSNRAVKMPPAMAGGTDYPPLVDAGSLGSGEVVTRSSVLPSLCLTVARRCGRVRLNAYQGSTAWDLTSSSRRPAFSPELPAWSTYGAC